MTPTRPQPLDREHPFRFDELLISTSDAKGIIRLTNRTFGRVSGYSSGELIGQAHNIVRHPDMPRAAFKVLWDAIGRGEPVAAYVKNLAKDGACYWVMALLVPVRGSYLSVGWKPSSPIFGLAQAVYAQLLAVERDVEADEPGRRELAIEASTARLDELLHDQGFDSYTTFMRAALSAEVAGRDPDKRIAQLIGGGGIAPLIGGGGIVPPIGGAGTAPLGRPGRHASPLAQALACCQSSDSAVRGLADALNQYERLGKQLVGKSEFLLGLAGEVRMLSLNAALVGARLKDGRALAAVADILGARSASTGGVIRELSADIDATVDRLTAMDFDAAVAKLLTEMMIDFVGELTDFDDTVSCGAEQLDLLARGVINSVELVARDLPELQQALTRLTGKVSEVRMHLNVIRSLEFNGRLEAVRASAGEEVRALFQNIGQQVGKADGEMAGFAILDWLAVLSYRDRRQHARDSVQQLQRAIGALASEAASGSVRAGGDCRP